VSCTKRSISATAGDSTMLSVGFVELQVGDEENWTATFQ
jgi:hypothetical protein